MIPGEEPLTIRLSSLIVWQDGSDIYHLKKPLLIHNKTLYVDDDDMQILELLNKGASQTATQFSERNIANNIRVNHAEQTFIEQYVQSNRQIESRYVATYTVTDRGLRAHDFSLEGDGKYFHGYLGISNQDNNLDGTYGILTIGSDAKSVILGNIDDPMNGSVFTNHSTNGIVATSLPKHLSYLAMERDGTGHMYGLERNYRTHDLTILLNQRNLNQSLFGIKATSTDAGIISSRELWISPLGMALGANEQTTGKAFGEVNAASSIGTMPLLPDDLQNRLDIGYHLTPTISVRIGYAHGYQEPVALYSSIDLQTQHMHLIFSGSNGSKDGLLYLHNNQSYVSVNYNVSDGQNTTDFTGGMPLFHGTLELGGYVSTTNDMYVQYSNDSAISPVIGYESTHNQTTTEQGPILGVAFAVSPNLSISFATHPTVDRRALRISISQRLNVYKRRPKDNHTVLLQGKFPGIATLYLDGEPVKASRAWEKTTIHTTSNKEILSARTEDGTYASLDTPVGEGSLTTVQLYPTATISGSVVISDPNHLLQTYPELSGLEIVVGDDIANAITDTNGHFLLQTLPLAPGLTITVSPGTLPTGLTIQPIEIQTIGKAPIVLTLKSSVQITTKKFPGH